MVVRIRLARHGSLHRPFYRLAVAHSKRHVQKKFLEHVGTFDPMPNAFGAKKVRVNLQRLKYWMAVGAQPSESVATLTSKIHLSPPPPNRSIVTADPGVLRGLAGFPQAALQKAQAGQRVTADSVYSESDKPSPFLKPLPVADLPHFQLSNPVNLPNLTVVEIRGIPEDFKDEQKVFLFLQEKLGYQPLNFLFPVQPNERLLRASFTVPNSGLEAAVAALKGNSLASAPLSVFVSRHAMTRWEAWKARELTKEKARALKKGKAEKQEAKSPSGVFSLPSKPRSLTGSRHVPLDSIIPSNLTMKAWQNVRAKHQG